MALEEIHSLPPGTASVGYEGDLLILLEEVENAPLAYGEIASQTIVNDGEGNPTLGYGYNLNDPGQTADDIQANILSALGLSDETDAELEQNYPDLWNAFQIITAWKDSGSWTDPTTKVVYSNISANDIIQLGNRCISF